MPVNNNTLNTVPLNGGAAAGNVIATGSGSLADIEQVTAIIGSGSLADMWQTVEFRASGSGSLADIEQVEQTIASGALVNLDQRVHNLADTTAINRLGWEATVVINGRNIPLDEISGSIDVTRTENDAALATVTLLPDTGVQDFTVYQGKDITIDVSTSTSTIRRIYTGIVDIVDVDLLEEKIVLRCTDKRRERIISNLANVVANTGFYSETIFGKSEDLFDELEKRLTTVPKTLDYDAYGQYRITNWAPKATADITFANADIYYDRPKVELISRGRIINKVNLQINYGYSRNHQRTASFSWNTTATVCKVTVDGYSLTTKQMVQDAADSSGWTVNPSGITFTPIFSSGWYSCLNAVGDGKYVGWSTQTTFGSTQVKTDADGNTVSDTNGNPVYEDTVRTKVVDYSDIYTTGASWNATKRWNQSIVEQYALTIQSTASQTAFGVVEQDLSYQIDSDTETTGWENDGRSDTLGTYYVDNRDNLAEYQNTVITAMNMAKTLILSGHRENRVTGEMFINPNIELYHTVRFNTSPVDATGKVSKLTHRLNVMTGEAVTMVEISMYNIGSGGSDSTLSIPAQPSDSVSTAVPSIVLGNNFGLEPTDNMTGMIGNAFVYSNANGYGTGYARTSYQEQFRVDTPEIEEVYRQTRILSGSSTYGVAIPSSTLTVTFDGKS